MTELAREPHTTGTFVLDTLDSSVQEFSIGPAQPPPRPDPLPLNDPEALDSYSRDFHSTLIRAHPEWRSLARVIPTDNGYVLSFFMELPSPSPKLRNLWISTEWGEVTVGFADLYHAHFVPHDRDETDSTVFDRAIRFVEDFMQERLVLILGAHILGTCGERYRGGWVQEQNEPLRIPEWLAPRVWYDRLQLLSWNCTFDRESAV